MFEKCITCDHISGCPHSPRFYMLSPPEVIDWCRKRKKFLGLSNDDIAEMSGLPHGTVSRLLGGNYADYKHTTIQPLLRSLTGDGLGELPCPTAQPEITELMEKYSNACARIEFLETHYQEDMLRIRADDQRQIDHLNAEIADFKEELEFKRQQLRAAHTGRIIMTVLCILLLLVIVAALVVDSLNPGIGFFWLDKISAVFSNARQGITDNIIKWKLL